MRHTLGIAHKKLTYPKTPLDVSFEKPRAFCARIKGTDEYWAENGFMSNPRGHYGRPIRLYSKEGALRGALTHNFRYKDLKEAREIEIVELVPGKTHAYKQD